MDNSTSVLVVEDEKEIRELMALHLFRQGCRVVECGSAEEALNLIGKEFFPLVILDWMLPGASGVDIIGPIKKASLSTSVLMVTAKIEPQDIVVGLEKGADDYLTKPFNPSVFVARVKALLRRSQAVKQETTAGTTSEKISIEGLVLNAATYEVEHLGQTLHLTPSEFKLLKTLMENHSKVLTRDQLIENIQGEGISVIGRTIDTHVFGLRKKLGAWGDRIETIRGVGYRVKTT
ncbi:MAG: response regulator [Pseudobdellovibrionaceae bacterium]